MKAGTIVTCCQCGAHQIKSTKDILPGGKMSDGAWESAGYDVENGIRMGCRLCGELWHKENEFTGRPHIHTSDGWIALSSEKPE